jgi:hypothetical protein
MNGKIKGLFCCLPQEQFYSFSVFGLHAQVVPFKAAHNLQQLAGELFSTAWFHSEPPKHSTAAAARKGHPSASASAVSGSAAGGGYPTSLAAEIAHAMQFAGTASRLATQRKANLSDPHGGAPDASKPGAPHIYRFSRYSTISNMQSIGREQLEHGVFLALCRVLVVQQLTVASAIEEADIMAGLQKGCDCVYSSET